MEGFWTGFCIKSIIDDIIFYFTGDTHKKSSAIKVNSENLLVNGELHFLCNFKAWRNLFTCSKNCINILQHLAHAHGATKDDIDADTAEELILKSNNWPIRIQRCMLQKERVCLFLNREDIIASSIKMAVECKMTLGKIKSTGKIFILKYQHDAQSALTTQRLHLIRNVTAKALNLHGHIVLSTGENCTNKYIFTSKSEGLIDEGYKKYVCGIVKNSQTNSKETCFTWEQYIKYKMNQLAELSEHKFIENEKNNAKDFFLHNLANAVIIFELMTVKPSRSVIIGNNNVEDDRNITNTRGASFVLYNTARIAAIIAKYNEKVSRGEYPSLPDIKNVDFSQLQEEEEWELIFNFVFGYSQMINDCLKCEPNFYIYPQVVCLFLLRLCQKFSVYYRKVRILTEGGDHLIPKMVARLYMLHALQVVFENALDILGIKPMMRM
ncbi:DALR anticodon-binding domain-containing protein 3 isoform X2 [Pogonomyrmex barbatus]|uniref:DALR anticodon-binding domain-containing protein 3 isoform X2 n=1 Tax=Pogonomyrmex barbatus TaxID=144034 RepID=A0A6I9WG44_9HYME|nr:DALR anticodon-binding domain-containing protein 3 isoform X2 [Pogonomyrmex barbatus]